LKSKNIIDKKNDPHRRRNPLTGDWVLVSPHRNKRPWQGSVASADTSHLPHYDDKCYLCPTNTRINGEVNPDYQTTFVFDNDFAAVHKDSPIVLDKEDALFQTEGVTGEARVICFSPDHSKTLPELTIAEIGNVIEAWCAETVALGERYPWVQVFENKGAMMGSSNPHPHGQIWATSFMPNEAAKEDTSQQQYYLTHERAMLLDVAEREVACEERVVVKTEYWLAIVPYWASWPFEILLLPLFAVQQLAQCNAEQREDLAHALQELTIRYDNLFQCAFPYSMGWHGAPFDLQGNSQDQPWWQLHAHFYPPLLRSASVRKFMVGYEMLAETQRDITPEEAAAMLRAVPTTHYKT
jgi:UDPglucose--hexose-1-phosphate uridylyltransferase